MKRRANGEGSIYRRPNGSWSALVSVTLPNGTPKRVCFTSKSHETVKAKLREILEQETRGIRYSDKKWTVGEYLDYWMREIHSKNIRETTMTSYNGMINNHIKPTMGGHRLRDLNVIDVRNALNEMEKQKRSAKIRLECLRVLSVCLNYAMSEEGGELVSRNVAQLIKQPRYIPKETVIWTERQAALFLRVIKDHPKYIAFLLIMVYGLRSGEAAGLRWNDIDFNDGYIHIRQQIGRIRGKLEARELKTENGLRKLPLRAIIRAALLEHAEKKGVTIPLFNPFFELSKNDTVVISNVNTPVEPRSLLRCFNILAKKAGLPCIKVQAMRHMAATMLKNLKVPEKDTQLLLGHSDISTTLKYYQHGTPETQCAAISAVEERLFGNAL